MTGWPKDREVAGLIAGFGLWALAFVALYGGHGLVCALGLGAGDGETFARIALALVWIVALAAHLWLIVWFRQRLRYTGEGALHFVRLASFILAVASFGATFWTGLPVLTVSICA